MKILVQNVFARRLFSSLLVIALCLGLLPIIQPAIAVGTFTVECPAHFIEVGGTAELKVMEDGTPYEGTVSFVSNTPSIATVDGNGIVTGIAIGRATIVAQTPGGDVSLEVPVVGANLLTRLDVKNGSFDGNVALGAAMSKGYFWDIYKGNSGSYCYMNGTNFSLAVPTRASYLYSSTHMLKLSSTGTTGMVGTNIASMWFTFRTYQAEPADGKQTGSYFMDPNKLYELTGWAKAENTSNLHNAWSALYYYFFKDSTSTYRLISQATNAMKVTPFAGKSGNQDWTYFATKPIENSALKDNTVLLQPRVEGGMLLSAGGWVGDLLFSDISFHEVGYDKMDFTPVSPVDALIPGNVVATTVKHYSTTGQEITALKVASNDANGTPITTSVPVPVTYESTNPAVASVSADGTITANDDGTATIKATATAGGITKTTTFDVSVATPNQDQAAPTGLAGVAPTSAANNNGKITGTTTAMEYKLSTDSTYISVTDTQITGLEAGTYEVRYAAKTGYNAGTDAEVVVPAYQAPTLSSIAVTTAPTKSTYEVGEVFDPTGMVITASYSDSTSGAVTGFTCSPSTALNTVGTHTITVSYTEGEATKTTTLDVTVNPETETLTSDGEIIATATNASNKMSISDAVTKSGDSGFTQGIPNKYQLGTSVTINASDLTSQGKTFRYWKHVPSGRIISTSSSYSFKVGSNSYITAVYIDTESGILVEFVDKNGKVLQSTCLDAETTSATAPTPYSVGYNFQGWKTSGGLSIAAGDTVTSEMIGAKDTTFIAQYNVLPADFALTVSGPATVTGGISNPYAYNTKVTVSVNDEAITDGKKFAYWQRDGKIMSYAASYSFYMWDTTTVTAVCVDEAATVTQVPQVMMDSVKTATGRIIFASERVVPDGFELVESGILINKDSGTAASLKLTGGSYDVKAISQSTSANGQFSVRRDGVSGTWYARAYVIYKSGSDIKVIYSNIVNGTVQ